MQTNTQTKMKPFKSSYVNPNSAKAKLAVAKSEKAPLAKPEPAKTKSTQVLEYLLEMRYSDLERLAKKFFRTPEMTDALSAKNLMGELISQGLVTIKKDKDSQVEIYLATAEAREKLVKESPKKTYAQVTKQVFWPRMTHDLLLADLRIRFEDLNFIDRWYSEASLKEKPLLLREFQDLPDAICKKRNAKSYFLELEVSMKSPKVYLARIEQYLKILAKEEIKDADITGVIFFCTDEKVQEKIKSVVPEGAKGISVMLYSSYFKTTLAKG